MKTFIVLILLFIFSFAQTPPYNFKKDIHFANSIKILDGIELKQQYYKDFKTQELSDFAYSTKRGLYGLSNKGVFFYFDFAVKNDKFSYFRLKKAYELKDENKVVLKKPFQDAEGMVLVNDTLYLSFEGVPRVESFSFTGRTLKSVLLPKVLRDTTNYRGTNKELEALAYDPKLGFVTLPELPLKKGKVHTIYTTSGEQFRCEKRAQATAIERFSNNTFLLLERSYDVFQGARVFLSKVRLDTQKHTCVKTPLLSLYDTENFESLTAIGNHRFLLGSDDNTNPLQKTVVLLLKIL